MVAAGALKQQAPVLPARGTLWGMWVRAPDLARARRAVGTVEGLDVSLGQGLFGGTGEGRMVVLARDAALMGRVEEVGPRWPLLELDFAQPVHNGAGSSVAMVPPGVDALVVWMRFDLLGDGKFVVRLWWVAVRRDTIFVCSPTGGACTRASWACAPRCAAGHRAAARCRGWQADL